MKVVREFTNNKAGRPEFLLDTGLVLAPAELRGRWRTWVMIKPTSTLMTDDWKGEVVNTYELADAMDVHDVLAWLQREEDKIYHCDLFADLPLEVKDELDRASNHIEAGDLRGALQHLAQFAAWTIQEYADTKLAKNLWAAYAPSRANRHPEILHGNAGWELWDDMNEMVFNTTFREEKCGFCDQPLSQCGCYCLTCKQLREDCHCGADVIPF